MLGVAFYERLDQSCLAYPGRANHGDNDRRSFLWQSVDQRDMQSLFFDLETFSSITRPCLEHRPTSWERAACLCKRPGLANAKAFGLDPTID